MHKRIKLMGIFGGIIVIIAVAIFFSYQSYSNISLSNDSQMTPNKTDKNNKTASKKTSKNNNIFLQDKDNPDRIIAIHPYGSNGVYQYRSQANGNLYPEYKYFNGQVSSKNNKLAVSPLKNTSAKSFSFKKNSDGSYHNTNNGHNYQKLATTRNDHDGLSVDDSSNDSVSDNTIEDGLNEILKDRSNPTYGNDTIDVSQEALQNYRHYIKLKNGDYYDANSDFFYGPNSEKFTTDDFKNNPDAYADPDYHIEDSMMYYKNNNQTHVTNEEINENVYWMQGLTGSKVTDQLLPDYSSSHDKNFDDSKPHSDALN